MRFGTLLSILNEDTKIKVDFPKMLHWVNTTPKKLVAQKKEYLIKYYHNKVIYMYVCDGVLTIVLGGEQ